MGDSAFTLAAPTPVCPAGHRAPWSAGCRQWQRDHSGTDDEGKGMFFPLPRGQSAGGGGVVVEVGGGTGAEQGAPPAFLASPRMAPCFSAVSDPTVE